MYIAADSQVSNKFDEIVRQSKQHDEPIGTIRIMTEHELLQVQKKLYEERIKKKESEEMSEQSSTSVSFARRSFSEDDWWKE